MQLFRYEVEYSTVESDTKVVLKKIQVVKETPKCFIITGGKLYGKQKLINKRNLQATRGYCADNKEKAMSQFIARNKKRLRWLKYWTNEVKEALFIAENNFNDYAKNIQSVQS